MTLSIAHSEDSGKVIQGCVRIASPPFDPQACVKEFSAVLKGYGVNRVTGDRYSGEWVVSSFQKEGIFYENSPLSKSELYLEFLALVMQGLVELLDNRQQTIELRQLERRTGKGRDSVDHPKGLHDDLANSCAGVCVLASQIEAPISLSIHSAFASSKESKFNELSSEDQEKVESMRKHAWLYDEEKKDKEEFERTVIEDDSTD